tara:strand:- start:552 stop:1169 length:618 start_codon:yes stop_codon:yes gene_type:complete
MKADSRVLLGKVVAAHGIRGGLRVRYFGDAPDHLSPKTDLQLCFSDGSEQIHKVDKVVPGKAREVRLFLNGISDRNVAESYKGADIFVSRRETKVLPEGEFYWYELVQCEVVTESGRVIGRVRELWEAGSQDLLVVESDTGEEILLPTHKAIVPKINLKEKRITVVDFPGLLEPALAGENRKAEATKGVAGNRTSQGDECTESIS